MADASDSGGNSGRRDERLDVLFTALADAQRRHVVRYFQSTESDVASVADIIDYTVEKASEPPRRDRLETTFHHVTFPKLADLGVIEYDARSRTVRYCGSPALERTLAVVTKSEPIAE